MSFAVKVAPEGATQIPVLLKTMRVWREAVRHTVDYIIRTRQTGLAKVYYALYYLLRERYGLPSRLAIDAIRQGIWIAKGWLRNPRRGKRPMIRGLWMVLAPKYSYTFKARDEVSVLTLDGRRTYKLCYVKRWHEHYKGWKLKEARLVLKDGRLWLKVVVENDVSLMKPEGALGVDVNYTNITTSDGIRLNLNAFRRAHRFKIEAERIQKRHRRSWRYVKAVRSRVKALGKRARNTITDACRKIGLEIAKHAYETRKAIVLENLTGLKEANRKGRMARTWRARLTLWAYRETQRWIEWKACLYGVPVLKVSPRGTSSTCPNCGSTLESVGNRRLRCPACGLEEDRDLIAAINLGMRGVQATLMAPDADENPSAMRGKLKNEGVKAPMNFSTAWGFRLDEFVEVDDRAEEHGCRGRDGIRSPQGLSHSRHVFRQTFARERLPSRLEV